MSTNATASVATSSTCFPTYEFKASFAKDGRTTLKVHNKTPTLDRIHSISIPSSPQQSPKPRFVELPEQKEPIMPCTTISRNTPTVEKHIEEQRETKQEDDSRLPSPPERSRQEERTTSKSEVMERTSPSLREMVIASRDRHVTPKSDVTKPILGRNVRRSGSLYSQVRVPTKNPQSGSPEIEETQSGETEDKTLTEDPLGPYGQLYDEYFRPEEYVPCAKSLRRKERDTKSVQDQQKFDQKWNETLPPLDKENKNTVQTQKETPSDLSVPKPSVPAERKWLYDLLHRKNPPQVMKRPLTFKDELREFFKMTPQKSKQREHSDKAEPPCCFTGTEYDLLEEFRQSTTFECLDLLIDWSDDKFVEKITPNFIQHLKSLDDHWFLTEVRGLRSQTNEVIVKVRQTERKDLIMKVLVASEQHRIWHECRALIDSGCTVSCINEETVKRFNLEKKPLEHAVPVRNADGTLNAARSITHVVTARLQFHLHDGTHEEVIQLAVTQLGREDIFLGYDWLQKHNPSIDWTKGQLDFDHCSSECCGAIYEQLKQGIREQDIRNISTNIAIEHEKSKVKKSFEQVVPEALHEYRSIFEPSAFDELPERRKWDHAIDFKPETNIDDWKAKVYPLPKTYQGELDKFLEENLRTGRIRPSKSPIPSPFFFISKKSGDLRPVQDYRQLNAMTVKNRYPLPLIPELIDQIKSARVYSKMDVRWGYNNVRIKEGDEWKAAFITNRRCFEPTVMFFGLCNSPATFQTMMNEIFREEIAEGWLHIYMDDFLVTADTKEENIERLRQVFTKCQEHKLFFKPEKCSFLQESVEYLGLIIRNGSISMDPVKVKAIRMWPSPTDVTELRSFLGFVNFYRQFIPNLAEMTLPLTPLTGKRPWSWDVDQENAFKAVVDAVVWDRVLAMPDNSLPYRVETDASDFAISAVLSQEFDGIRKPIAFISKSFTETERNYTTYDKELYAILFAVESWRHYLLDVVSTTDVLSDHRNLAFYRTPQNLSRRQARWVADLQEYDLVIRHVPGRLNARADALSRRADYVPPGTDNSGVVGLPDGLFFDHSRPLPRDPVGGGVGIAVHSLSVDFLPLHADFRTEIAKEMTPDKIDVEVSLGLERKSPEWLTAGNGLVFRDGLVYIPSSATLRAEVIRQHHDPRSAGHPRTERTMEAIQRNFWWPCMHTEIATYVQACQDCQRMKIDRTARHAPLVPHAIPPHPWHTISIDMIGPLPVSHGNDAILVIVDKFSKRLILEPITTELTALGVAKIYKRRVFSQWGLVDKVISDRGSMFVSEFMKELYKLLEIEKNASTAYHPQTDGQTERMNQEIETYLRFFTNYDQDDWAQQLPLAEFTYNDHRNKTTGFSPFFLTTGTHPWKGFEPRVNTSTNCDAAEKFAKAMTTYWEKAKEGLRHAQDLMKDAYNRTKRAPVKYEPGDKVLLDARNLNLRRPSAKLAEKHLGPFEVVEKFGTSAYKLKLPISWKIHPVFNELLLRPHVGPRFPGQNAYDRPPPEVIGDQEEYDVEEILDTRRRWNRREYLVKWKGYPSEDNTWEPEKNLTNTQQVITDFQKRLSQRT